MRREPHVRFCEGAGVKLPRATRPVIFGLMNRPRTNLGLAVESGELRQLDGIEPLVGTLHPYAMLESQWNPKPNLALEAHNR